jgi:hypothetical protein
MQLSEDFEYVISKFGEPTPRRAISTDHLNELRHILPTELVDFLVVYGECSMAEGRIQVCDPILYAGLSNHILGTDRDFGKHASYLFCYTSFGRLSFWNKTFGLHTVYLYEGLVSCAALSNGLLNDPLAHRGITVPFGITVDDLDNVDDSGKKMFARAKKRLGPLEVGECYGFFPLLGLGGPRKVEQLRRVRALEHFSMVAQTTDLRLIDSQSYGQVKTIRLIDK